MGDRMVNSTTVGTDYCGTMFQAGDAPHTTMQEEELTEEDMMTADLNQLEESKSIRHVKEEWTRLQVEADGLQNQLLKAAGQIRDGSRAQEGEEMDAGERCWTDGGDQCRADGRASQQENLGLVAQQLQWQQVKMLPRTRLPSLVSMKDPVPTFASINMCTFDRNIFEARYGETPTDTYREKEVPQKVTLSQMAYSFGSGTPTQTDIKWTPPANASLFSRLLYDIEMDSGQGWTALSESRLPILRVYFTSEKIIMGRFSRFQEAKPVSMRLRIRAVENEVRQAEEYVLQGPWSEEIWLTLEGSHVSCNTAL